MRDTQQNPIPDAYSDVDPVLVPLIEYPSEWLSDVDYETELGPPAGVEMFRPDAVTFGVDVSDLEHWATKVTEYANNDSTNAVVVENRPEAQETDSHCIWIELEREDTVFIGERIPFTRRVTTPAGIRDEFREIVTEPPHWENIFEKARHVARSLGLEPTDPIS
jgi:hypothetical protein